MVPSRSRTLLLRSCLSLLVALCGHALRAQTTFADPLSPTWVARLAGEPESSAGSAFDVEGGGAGVFVVGSSRGGVNTLSGPSTSLQVDLGVFDPFYAGLSAEGAPLWLRPSVLPAGSIPPTGPVGYHVAATPGLVVTGEGASFFLDEGGPGPWAIGSSVLTGRDPATGEVLWTRMLGTPDDTLIPRTTALVLGIEVEPDGSVFVAGLFRDTLALGPDVLVPTLEGGLASGTYDAFVGRLTRDGVPVWGAAVGGVGEEWISLSQSDPRGAFDVGGGVYLAGSFPEGSTVRRGTPGAVVEREIPAGPAVLVWDRDGNLLDAVDREALGVTTEAYPYGLAAPQANDSAVSGFALSWSFPRAPGAEFASVRVGGRVLTDPGFGGRFVSRHRPNGALDWAIPITGGGNEVVGALAVGPDGRTWVGGDFDGAVLRLGRTNLRRGERGDGFVAVVSPDGLVRAYIHATGPGFARVEGIAVDADGAAYVAGSYRQSVGIGDASITAAGRGEVFVARFDARDPVATETSVEPAALPRLTIAPNPTSLPPTIVVERAAPGRILVEVFDVLGRSVFETVEMAVPSGRASVPLGDARLAPGAYTVRATVLGSAPRSVSGTFVVVR